MRRRCLPIVLALGAVAAPTVARAHHVPGHGGSEGAKQINGVGGGSAQAQTRFFLLGEYARDSTSENPSHTTVVSGIAEVAPHPWISLGVQAPLSIVAEDDVDRVKVGYGDTRAFVRFTPHGDKLVHRVLTLSLSASFPTRTFRFLSDPGRSWLVSPAITFTRTYSRLFWMVFANTSIETRPAGTAFEFGAAGQLGYRFFERRPLTPALGVLVDTRYLTLCEQVDGSSQVCPQGRVTERDRPLGATRVYLQAALSWRMAKFGERDQRSLDLYASGQVAVTRRRDFDGGASLGLMLRL